MIKISSLSFTYPQSTTAVFNDLNLEIQPGTMTLLAGASGSGKSTFLRCLNGLVPHFSGGIISGKINVFGSEPIKEGPEHMASRVGFVFQDPESQFVFDIVEDEIAFPLENMAVPRREMHQRVDEIIHEMQLTNIFRKNTRDISGGEKQKVVIASALVCQPQVLILDEPTSQLDPVAANEIIKYIVKLKSQLNLTVLIAEHRLERLLPYIDNILYLTQDQKMVYGHPQKVLPIMDQVPPIIDIAKGLDVFPLPLSAEDFPDEKKRFQPVEKEHPHDENKDSLDPFLDVNNLSVNLSDQKILHNISMQVNKGEILIIMGPNGAGKTTLLRALMGLIPSNGSRHFMGDDMTKMTLTQIIQHIAYLPQNPNDLLFADTILDELKTTLKNHNKSLSPETISAFLKHFGLADFQHRYPRELSGGERQRTAIAAITVHNPKIIFLDEPTRGMDYKAKETLSDLFHEWCRQDKSVLLVTHDVEFAANIADRVAIIEHGKVKFYGSPKRAFQCYPAYQSQTAKLFPNTGWIIPEDIVLTT